MCLLWNGSARWLRHDIVCLSVEKQSLHKTCEPKWNCFRFLDEIKLLSTTSPTNRPFHRVTVSFMIFKDSSYLSSFPHKAFYLIPFSSIFKDAIRNHNRSSQRTSSKPEAQQNVQYSAHKSIMFMEVGEGGWKFNISLRCESSISFIWKLERLLGE